MVTPGTTPPDESVIVPEMLPVVDPWAETCAAQADRIRTAASVRSLLMLDIGASRVVAIDSGVRDERGPHRLDALLHGWLAITHPSVRSTF
jgi:hypothetical protein